MAGKNVSPESKKDKKVILEEVVTLIHEHDLNHKDIDYSGRAFSKKMFEKLKYRRWDDFSIDRAYLIRDSAWERVGIKMAA